MRKTYIMAASLAGLVGMAWLVYDHVETHRKMADLAVALSRSGSVPNSTSASTPALPPPVNAYQILAALTRPTAPAANAESAASQVPANPAANSDRLPTQEQVQETVLSAYAKEENDSSWSRNAERQITAELNHELPDGSRLLSVECRTTMCYIEVSHTDDTIAGSFLMKAFREWHGGVMVAGQEKNGTGATQALVAFRENTVPPYARR